MFNRALTIKSDVNGLLDIARATFCEYVDLLEEYVQVIHSNYGTRKPYSKDYHFFCCRRNWLHTANVYCIMAYSLPSLQRKSHLCILFLEIVWPHSQFPHSCVCERFIYSQDWSTYFLQQNRQIDC
jgi:hypothetical protein